MRRLYGLLLLYTCYYALLPTLYEYGVFKHFPEKINEYNGFILDAFAINGYIGYKCVMGIHTLAALVLMFGRDEKSV